MVLAILFFMFMAGVRCDPPLISPVSKSYSTTRIETTILLTNPTLTTNHQNTSLQTLIFWIFSLGFISTTICIISLRAYKVYEEQSSKPQLKTKEESHQDSKPSGDQMVYGTSSIKSSVDSLAEIYNSYPGYPARSPSIGYIEAIYARYSAGNEQEMISQNEIKDKPMKPLRIQINGNDIIQTKKSDTVTPYDNSKVNQANETETKEANETTEIHEAIDDVENHGGSSHDVVSF
eukprot:UN01562